MPSTKELDKEMMERLYDLMVLKAMNQSLKIKGLNDAIIRAKAPMSKEQIAWVEALVKEKMAAADA